MKKNKKQKKLKRLRGVFLQAFLLTVLWNVVILSFVLAAFSFGVKEATSNYVQNSCNQVSKVLEKRQIMEAEKKRQDIYMRKLRERVETFIRQNLATVAKENNAGDDSVVAGDVCFINDDRALVFYNSNNDRYLAEVVFRQDSAQIKIDRFILKVKNDTDYSGGVYGAD